MSDDEAHYIMRICFDETNPDHRTVVRKGLTLDEAQAHSQDSRTAGNGWGDHYYRGEPSSPVRKPTHTTPLPLDLSENGEL